MNKSIPKLQQLFLTWSNCYLTTETFALDNDLSYNEANLIIQIGRIINNEKDVVNFIGNRIIVPYFDTFLVFKFDSKDIELASTSYKLCKEYCSSKLLGE